MLGVCLLSSQRLAVMLRHPASCAHESLFGRPSHRGSGVRQDGHLRERPARRFGIARSTVKRYAKRLGESGSLAPKRMLGKRPKLLRSGQVIVMDNLGAHKDRRVKELIETRGR